VLNELDQALGTSLEPKTVAETTLQHISNALQAPKGALVLWNPSAPDHLTQVLTSTQGWIEISPPDDAIEWVRTFVHNLAHQADTKPLSRQQVQDLAATLQNWSVESPSPDALIIPIWKEKDLVAVLGLSGRKFTAEDRAIAQATAVRAGQAIQNARLYAATRSYADRMAYLYQIGQALTATLDYDSVASNALVHVQRLFHADGIALFQSNPETGELQLTRGSNKDTMIQAPLVLPAGKGIAGWSLTHREPILVENVQSDPRFSEREIQCLGSDTQSVMAVPLLTPDRDVGVIEVASYKPDVFGRNELNTLQAVASILPMALENARLYEQQRQLLHERKKAEERIRRRNRELAVLNEISQAVISTLDLHETLALVTTHTNQLLNVAATAIVLHDADNEDLWFAAASGEGSDFVRNRRMPQGQGIVGWVIQTGEPILVPDVSRDTRFFAQFDQQSGFTTRSILCVPLQTKGRTIGAIEAMNKDDAAFGPEDLKSLTLLAAPAAAAIENARLFEAAQRQLEELTILHAVAVAVTESTHENELIERVTEVIGAILYPDSFGVALVNTATGVLSPHPSYRTRTHAAPRALSLREDTQLEALFNAQTPFASVRFCEIGSISGDPKMQSQLCIPLRTGSQILGIINAESTKSDAFTKDDERLLTTVAGQLATAIEKARLFKAEREAREQTETLRQATAALSSTLEMEEILDSLLTHLEQVIPYSRASLFLQQEDKLKAVAARGFSHSERLVGKEFPSNNPLILELERTRMPLVLADAQSDPRFEGWAGSDETRGWMGVPFVAQKELIGFLVLDSQTVGIYGKAEARLAQAFANQAAVAIQNARFFEQVRAGRERLKHLSHRLVEVQEIERRFIARELHDEIGQTLTGLKLALEMSMHLPPEAVQESLAQVQELVDGLLGQVRDLSLDLRPAMLDDLGLLPTLLWHFERYTTQTNIQVNFEHTGIQQRFPPPVETAAYRIIQEALTNIARHANASNVAVEVWTGQDTLALQVTDDGVGFDIVAAKASQTSSGLSGMHERAALLGGHLSIESAPGQGTVLTARLPTLKVQETHETYPAIDTTNDPTDTIDQPQERNT
jgi:GAF domain-containing protein